MAPMGVPGRSGGLENRGSVCAGKLKDKVLRLQSDGEPLKAAELGEGQGWSWASGPAPECTLLCRTQGDSRVEGGLATVLAASSEASGGQWPWKGATLVPGVHTVAHGPGQARQGGGASGRAYGLVQGSAPHIPATDRGLAAVQVCAQAPVQSSTPAAASHCGHEQVAAFCRPQRPQWQSGNNRPAWHRG